MVMFYFLIAVFLDPNIANTCQYFLDVNYILNRIGILTIDHVGFKILKHCAQIFFLCPNFRKRTQSLSGAL